MFLHDKAAREYRRGKAERLRHNKNELDERIREINRTFSYTSMFHEDGQYAVIGAKDSDGLMDEGETLNHCVFQYVEEFARGHTYIYFIREKQGIGTPFFTAELKKIKKIPSVSGTAVIL